MERAKQAKESIFAMFHVMHRLKHLVAQVTVGDTTNGESVLLHLLRENEKKHPEQPGTPAGSIARHIHTSPPAVSRTLRNLEERALIFRQTDPSQRRVVRVYLTDAGRKVLQDYYTRMESLAERVEQGMGTAQLAELMLLLRQLEAQLTLVDTELEEEKKARENKTV